MKDDLERRLAATDFSADSRVRRSLRAGLLERRRAAPSRVAALALAFAVVALIFLLPLTEHHPDYFDPVPDRVVTTPPPLPAKRKSAYPRGAQGLPVLPGVLAERAGAHEHPIEVHRGRVVRGKDASSVVWEIDGTRYGLETRRITLQDIFETRAL